MAPASKGWVPPPTRPNKSHLHPIRRSALPTTRERSSAGPTNRPPGGREREQDAYPQPVASPSWSTSHPRGEGEEGEGVGILPEEGRGGRSSNQTRGSTDQATIQAQATIRHHVLIISRCMSARPW